MQDSATPTHAAGEGAVTRDLASYVSRLLAGRLASGGPIDDFESHEARGGGAAHRHRGLHRPRRACVRGPPGGLEELAEAFDAYFSDLVGLVYGHGGDVLAIAGDAFFSFWPARDGSELPGAVLRAVEAGLAIQAGLARVGPARHSFGTRVGISAGDLRIAFVGRDRMVAGS